ncbi:MAG: glycosyltransferase family 2 protein [Caldilineaceae bacterium]|nr:glycosyltransferase family 2 protein [Caldilineaceae bacterium]
MAFASVIIPVWNGIDDLPACLSALADQSHTTLEIIAVDNASTDGSAHWIATYHPSVRLICNNENRGFGDACNTGMAQAGGDILVLLNQDTIVERGWLAALVSVLEENSDIGIAGSKALYPDGTIQHAGGVIDVRGASTHLGYRQEDKGQFDHLADVEYVTGASLALRRTLYEQIGGFDPGFSPAYLEDVDLCWRARAAGWRVVYAPQSVLVHNERSTAATPNYAGALLYHRHRLRFVFKHWPVERLRDEFLPAEIAWMTQLKPLEEEWLAAAHHGYMVQLLNLGDLSTWRQALLGEAPEAIETVAQLLLALRRVYPLELMGTSADRTVAPLRPLQAAQLLADIHEQPFRSNVPIIGRWIAAFRQQWNRVSTEWYVKPMIRQQSHFNALLLTALTQGRQEQHDQQQRAALVLTEYLEGHSSEISELAQEVERLKRLVAELRQTPQQRSQG